MRRFMYGFSTGAQYAPGAKMHQSRQDLRDAGHSSPGPAPGMHGCGMLILNTPWRLDEELAAVLPKPKAAGKSAG